MSCSGCVEMQARCETLAEAARSAELERADLSDRLIAAEAKYETERTRRVAAEERLTHAKAVFAEHICESASGGDRCRSEHPPS